MAEAVLGFTCLKRALASDPSLDATLAAKLEITVISDLGVVIGTTPGEGEGAPDIDVLSDEVTNLIFSCNASRADFVKKQLDDLYQIFHYLPVTLPSEA